MIQKRPQGLHRPRSTLLTGSTASREPSVTNGGSRSRSRDSSAPSAPNTARRMAPSVTRIIEGSVANSRSSGQEASSRTVSSSMIFSYAASRRPWNGGTSSLRCLRWSAPVSANSEPGPSTRPRLGSRLSTSSGPAVKSCLTCAGSLITTAPPKIGTLMVKASPYRSRSRRSPRSGRVSAETPCARRGADGPGGSVTAVISDNTFPAWYAAVPRQRYAVVPFDSRPPDERYSVSPVTTVRLRRDEESRADAERFRRRLLDALAASIAEKGYQNTTIADIVRGARTSRRTFYENFPS